MRTWTSLFLKSVCLQLRGMLISLMALMCPMLFVFFLISTAVFFKQPRTRGSMVSRRNLSAVVAQDQPRSAQEGVDPTNRVN